MAVVEQAAIRHRLRLGYNTNGFAHHRLEEALALLAELGYDGVALTLDIQHLDPERASRAEIAAVRRLLERLGLGCVIETGARYVLDPRRKHEPSLLSDREGATRRLAWLERCFAIAAELGAEALSVVSGRPDPALCRAAAWARLEAALESLIVMAERHRVVLGIEPEPGMLLERLADYDRLREHFGPALGLTLDLGHVCVSETICPAEAVRRHADAIVHVHIEDIRGRVHAHLPFGEGDHAPAIRAALAALAEARYGGLVSVELSRNSHDAPVQAERALRFLRAPWSR